MPIYAYRCAECGHAYDRLQKLSDPDPEICPECGASALKRQLTAPSFRLSGSGWYETDFKKDGDRKRNLTEGGEGASKGGEGASQGDGSAGGAPAKPADAAAAKPAPPADKSAASDKGAPVRSSPTPPAPPAGTSKPSTP